MKRPGTQETIEPGGDLPKRTHPDQNSPQSACPFDCFFFSLQPGPPTVHTSRHLASARYLLAIAFADLRRTTFALVDLIAALRWCAAALLLRRTPGCSPFVNSTPASSSARCNASIVRSFNSSPRSNLATVSIETFAAAARSRMPKPTAARAIRHWIGRIIIAQLRF